MEKGMAGDRTTDAAAQGGLQTVAPPDPGMTSKADTQGKGGRKKSGGAPSGSITHPREGFDPQATLSKDADGTWRITNDEAGATWTWDAAAEMWRGEGDAEDIAANDIGGGPEEQARWLSGVARPPESPTRGGA
jgi:hypothetical protein